MRARPPPRAAPPCRTPSHPASLPRPARDAVDYLATVRQSRDGILSADDRVIEGLLTAQTGAALDDLCSAAVSVRDAGRPGTRLAAFSPKVFLPVTRLCRDSCGYCTFVRAPSASRAAFLFIDAAIATAAAGAAAGATEALLTLGDAPETVHPGARAELDGLGFDTTIDYVAAMAAAVREATGLLPHTNVGLVDDAQAAKLRRVAVSQGLMLETAATDLPAHAGCMTKTPSARLAALAALGRARVPTTTGLLVGIGETVGDRLAGLLAIARTNAIGGGHIAECIIQPFRPKPGTAMAGAPPASTTTCGGRSRWRVWCWGRASQCSPPPTSRPPRPTGAPPWPPAPATLAASPPSPWTTSTRRRGGRRWTRWPRRLPRRGWCWRLGCRSTQNTCEN